MQLAANYPADRGYPSDMGMRTERVEATSTDALARWASPLSETFMYAGVTRVHELQVISAEGGLVDGGGRRGGLRLSAETSVDNRRFTRPTG